MFRDKQEELDRLQAELLAEEEPELPEPDPELLTEETLDELLDLRTYNTDRVDVDTEQWSEELLKPPSRKLGCMTALIVILTVGILAAVSWWLLGYLEVLPWNS